jgi:hypothetical protein
MRLWQERLMGTMPFEDLEIAYEILARAIDAAGPDKEALFLARLALVLAHETGNISLFQQAVATALEDMARTNRDPPPM